VNSEKREIIMSMSQTLASQHTSEVEGGNRFEFGRNWASFLSVLDERRIEQATRSLATMLGVEDLRGKSFLDVGSGSGLSSLAASRLGASRIHSLDYDPHSVACTHEVKRRHGREAGDWTIDRGSALDRDYLGSLGAFDVVYSWGVLHHTGAMWEALGNMVPLVAPGSLLHVAIYNDQGGLSQAWRAVKRGYNALPGPLKLPYAVAVTLPRGIIRATLHTATLRPHRYITQWFRGGDRGMSGWYDLIDWVGGYPFEVAKPEEIFKFYQSKNFTLKNLRTVGGKSGCNHFVFVRGDSR
jgi:2-polyprenyl-6-hydroxyphenyl methylase/3-demethylubiquinone-9 3-methyltransferase